MPFMRTIKQQHLFHLVISSPWPLLTSFSLLALMLNAVTNFHIINHNLIKIWISFFCLSFCIFYYIFGKATSERNTIFCVLRKINQLLLNNSFKFFIKFIMKPNLISFFIIIIFNIYFIEPVVGNGGVYFSMFLFLTPANFKLLKGAPKIQYLVFFLNKVLFNEIYAAYYLKIELIYAAFFLPQLKARIILAQRQTSWSLSNFMFTRWILFIFSVLFTLFSYFGFFNNVYLINDVEYSFKFLVDYFKLIRQFFLFWLALSIIATQIHVVRAIVEINKAFIENIIVKILPELPEMPDYVPPRTPPVPTTIQIPNFDQIRATRTFRVFHGGGRLIPPAMSGCAGLVCGLMWGVDPFCEQIGAKRPGADFLFPLIKNNIVAPFFPASWKATTSTPKI